MFDISYHKLGLVFRIDSDHFSMRLFDMRYKSTLFQAMAKIVKW